MQKATVKVTGRCLVGGMWGVDHSSGGAIRVQRSRRLPLVCIGAEV